MQTPSLPNVRTMPSHCGIWKALLIDLGKSSSLSIFVRLTGLDRRTANGHFLTINHSNWYWSKMTECQHGSSHTLSLTHYVFSMKLFKFSFDLRKKFPQLFMHFRWQVTFWDILSTWGTCSCSSARTTVFASSDWQSLWFGFTGHWRFLHSVFSFIGKRTLTFKKLMSPRKRGNQPKK